MFKEGVCVNPSGVLDERPNHANIAFSELFDRHCFDRLEVIDKGPDYATSVLLELCAGARCPPKLALSRVAVAEAQS